jgi:hypothetical protein
MKKIYLQIVLVFLISNSSLAQQLFPGDTNNDGVCNYLDLLPIGISYGQTGPSRPGASLDWLPQAYTDWPGTLPGSALNLAFADADGNGQIDSLDLDAFLLNYDSVQAEAIPEPGDYFPGDTVFAELFIEATIDEDTVEAGDTVFMQLNFLPEPTFPATGLALAIEYDTSLVVDSLVRFIPDTLAGDLLFVWATSQGPSIWRSPQPGRLEIAASGKGVPAFDVQRPIGTVQFIIVEDITRSDSAFVNFKPEIKSPIAVRPDGAVAVPFFDSPEVTLFQLLSADSKRLAEKKEIICFPNPFENEVSVRLKGEEIHQIEVVDISGIPMESYLFNGEEEVTLSLGHLQPGMYMLKLFSSRHISVQQLIKK